jgi:hypothetical protein
MAIEFQYYGQVNLLSKIKIARSGIKKWLETTGTVASKAVISL